MNQNSFSIEIKDNIIVTSFHSYDSKCFHDLYLKYKDIFRKSELKSDFTSIVDLSYFVDNNIIISNQDIGYIHLISKLGQSHDISKLILIPKNKSVVHEIIVKVEELTQNQELSFACSLEEALKYI